MARIPGTLNFHVAFDAGDLEATMARLDTSLSAAGLSLFLTGVVQPWIKERAMARFDQEGDDVSGPWMELAPSTQDIRARGEWGVGPGSPINRRTGDLERYITESTAAVAPVAQAVTMVYPGKPAAGPLAIKVQTAQSGKPKPKTVPRPVLGVNEKDLLFVMTALSLYVEDGVIR